MNLLFTETIPITCSTKSIYSLSLYTKKNVQGKWTKCLFSIENETKEKNDDGITLKKKHTVNLHTEGGCSWPQFHNLHGIYALNARFMIFGIKLYYLWVFIYIKLFKYVYIYFVFQLFYPKLRRLCFLSEAESIFRANREGFFYSFF